MFGSLVMDNKNISDIVLKTEAEHIAFAKLLATVLERSELKIHIVEFFKELLQNMSQKLGSKDFQVFLFLYYLYKYYIGYLFQSECFI